MLFAVLIFTEFHDVMTSLSSLFGLLALVGIFKGLYESRLIRFIWAGVFCGVLMGLNNYIYYSNDYLYALPLVQKITFAFVLLWIVFLNIKFSTANRNKKNKLATTTE